MRYIIIALCLVGLAPPESAATPVTGAGSLEWDLVNPNAAWRARAGLQVVQLGNSLYLMGGRTPNPPRGGVVIPGDSEIWGDVWRSDDQGRTWRRILETDDASHWPARAYFEAVERNGRIYVLGGQNFKLVPNPVCPVPSDTCPPLLPASDFFSDVWSSNDGVRWKQHTADAGWDGRAGLMAVTFRGAIYVMGGSVNDDSSITPGGPARIYFNDVWVSRDGANWTQLVEEAPWPARAGGAVVVKNGYIWLIGGEAGFLCGPPPCQLPYFNDVWRTRDGVHWEQVTAAADWVARPGHKCAVIRDEIVCFGGFGFPVNPMDVWTTRDGASWRKISDRPWNAFSPEQIKYDFDALAVAGAGGGLPPSILTFGGDRETFDFADTTNYLRIDNDVWRFTPPAGQGRRQATTAAGFATRTIESASVAPNPLRGTTMIQYSLVRESHVDVDVFDARGRRVRSLVSELQSPGRRAFPWDALDPWGRRVAPGLYYARIAAGPEAQMLRLVVLE